MIPAYATFYNLERNYGFSFWWPRTYLVLITPENRKEYLVDVFGPSDDFHIIPRSLDLVVEEDLENEEKGDDQ